MTQKAEDEKSPQKSYFPKICPKCNHEITDFLGCDECNHYCNSYILKNGLLLSEPDSIGR